MPNWWLEQLKMGGVTLIMALDHHEHPLHIINGISRLDQWHHVILRNVQLGALRWS